MSTAESYASSAIIAGPILRRLEPSRLLIWLVATERLPMELTLQRAGADQVMPIEPDGPACRVLAVGARAFVHLLDVRLAEPLPVDTLIEYDLAWRAGGEQHTLASALPHLLHPGRTRPSLMIASSNRTLLHGSCRKPHYPCGDGLVRADAWLAERLDQPDQRPAWLIMSGDQVYVDDVAGPMLRAVHLLVERLGLFDEKLEGATVDDSQSLYRSEHCYYRREELLPDIQLNMPLRERFFGGAKKPVFTSAHAHNHLMTFGEVLAMYLLSWSPQPWRLIDLQAPELSPEQAANYAQEKVAIDAFVQGLPQSARVMAHLPSLMIFDDNPSVAI
ncbi:MAG: hypothetical protein JKY26_12195 [Pseudomonas sp.]|nr:hypothetical protein [Pseudomonas sp.]